MPGLKSFLNRLGIEPRDMSVYRRAMTHISVASTHFDSYERLEFLGDSVIGIVVSEFLFQRFKDKEEGGLSRIRAMVVSQETLGARAKKIGLDEYLRADTVRIRGGEQAEISILADSFEALVGAIFADRGYRHARSFVLRQLKDECLDLQDMDGPSDYKSRLQELWQQMYKDIPEYKVVSEVGPDHRKEFTVEVRYRRRILGRGKGSSKKRAEQEAAQDAFERQLEKEGKKRRKE